MSSLPTNLAPDPDGVFLRHADDVYGWAYRLLGRHHDAADVVQDVFLRWLLQGRLDQPANPRPWLRRVTINRAVDMLRSRRTLATRDTAVRGAEPAAAATAPTTAELDETRMAVAEAMETLTSAQRSVLVAKVYDGLTFTQIAAESGLAVPTVKTHYLRALEAVRRRLAVKGFKQDQRSRS